MDVGGGDLVDRNRIRARRDGGSSDAQGGQGGQGQQA
jgi:hypothetical protein